jgi:2-oxoglutarate dehydrogenase E2 component (dihydrolipoamide succinyltransferase)
MIDIEVPKLNNNDESYELTEWLVADEATVSPQEPLVVVETSKAQQEIEAPGPGILLAIAAPGSRCCPGDVIGRLFETAEERDRYASLQRDDQAAAADGTGPVLTRGARELAERHGVSHEQLARLGRPVIRASDVEALLATSGSGVTEADGHPLSTHQQAVAATVTESMRTIPAAAVYVVVNVDAALSMAGELRAQEQTLIGLPDFLVRAVALLHSRFPDFFASLRADGRLVPAAAAHVGVTIDTGNGLYVPVLRDAAGLGLTQTADALLDLRLKALRATLRAADFEGANILVAPHDTAGVILATPIVFPEQVCVVSLGGAEERLTLAADGSVLSHRQAIIGVVYDHRVVNGRAAQEFAIALKALLESPEQLADADTDLMARGPAAEDSRLAADGSA